MTKKYGPRSAAADKALKPSFMAPTLLKYASIFLVLTLNAVANDQVPLNASPVLGTLHRFLRNESRVVNELQQFDVDIWQATPELVDIYTPLSGPGLPEALRAIPSTSSPIYYPYQQRQVEPWNLASFENTTFHSAYHPLYEIDDFVYQLAAEHPSTVSVIHLGHSGEGREMRGLKISSGSTGVKKTGYRKGVDPSQKLGFVVAGAQHAREWVATAAALYIAHALVATASEKYSLSPLLGTYDFYIIPAPNPDGYDFTWESDRFWYKNRQVMGPAEKCIGLDMNRNWGYKWKANAMYFKNPATPVDPCSHWFPGHRPFEAPEVNNLANYITTLPNLLAFVDLRSYGQMISSPYSYSCERVPKDAEDQIEAATGAAHALKLAHGTKFKIATLCESLYRAPGNIVDWMYARAQIKYSYAVHLRDTGTYGFSLPPEWIRPVGEETGNMVKYLAGFIAKQLKKKIGFA
ncbi:peptidase M14 [Guyanagaster necrorhizus]|uniref:Peptidase M14 n=1 Tax=Guyanagaster necrorhizus TaxID=856835 RepID=A0A9P7VGM0_9AGAR|nr:peptidase M14 [Guyanagaster necrorhizus MCA 3950]KAG7440202.1 peptidase M14 [Guyanagaster necrorhizus MCA 3950]